MSEHTPAYTVGETLALASLVRVVDVSAVEDGELTVAVVGYTGRYDLLVPVGAVSLARHAPAGGPVRPGDVWRDAQGGAWVAYTHTFEGVLMGSADGARAREADRSPLLVHQAYTLTTLLYRLPEPEPAEDTQTAPQTPVTAKPGQDTPGDPGSRTSRDTTSHTGGGA